MIVLNDDLFIFSLSYLVYFIGMGVISTISFTATGLFSISMALKNKNQDKQLSATSVSGFVRAQSMHIRMDMACVCTPWCRICV